MVPETLTDKPLEPVAIHRSGSGAFGNREPEPRPPCTPLADQDGELAIAMAAGIGENAAEFP